MMKIGKGIAVWIIVILFILIFTSNYAFFVAMDTGPANSETDSHLERFIEYYKHYYLKSHSGIISPYPPGFYMVPLIYVAFAGESFNNIRMGLIFFSILYLVSMFLIGRELGGNASGLAVMALSAGNPHFLNHCYRLFPDIPQTAVTAYAFYVLLKTEGFTSRKWTLFYCVALSIALLTKWSAGLFLILPTLYFIIPALGNKRGATLFTVIAVLYVLILKLLVNLYTAQVFFQPEDPVWVTVYLKYILIPFGLLFLTGASCEILWRRRKTFDPPTEQILNFFYAFSILPITLVWYIFAWSAIVPKLASDLTADRVPLEIINMFCRFLDNSYPFIPILLMIGLYFTFTVRENRRRNLIIPINMAFFILFFTLKGYATPRYALGIAIFIAVLGGFWVSYLGRAGKVLSVIMLFTSIYIMSTWANSDNPEIQRFRLLPATWNRYIHSQIYLPPDNRHFNRHQINDQLFGKASVAGVTMIFPQSFPFRDEYIQAEAFDCLKLLRVNQFALWQDFYSDVPEDRMKVQGVLKSRNMVILYEDKRNIEALLKKAGIEPDRYCRKDIRLDESRKATVLKRIIK